MKDVLQAVITDSEEEETDILTNPTANTDPANPMFTIPATGSIVQEETAAADTQSTSHHYSDSNSQADPELTELQSELHRFRIERQKVLLRQQIEEEKSKIAAINRSRQKSINSNTPNAPGAIVEGELINLPANLIADLQPKSPQELSNKPEKKALQIINFLWPDPVPTYNTFTGGNMR
ncbi:hypothetical protein SNE40_017580 [Patella caerulea]|uniref:Uncharacterized protein n=1 Tax=Patella caerulea TaxID=87958 RepID=A0AAN8PEC3_PATCE